MKYFLLLLLIISIVIGVGVVLTDRVIVLQLVIPQEWLPYYEWLISFPGINLTPDMPLPEKFPSNNTYNA